MGVEHHGEGLPDEASTMPESQPIEYPPCSRPDPLATRTAAGVPASKILGVPVSTLTLPIAVATILRWVRLGEPNFVCVRDVHGLMRAREDPALMDIHFEAGMITTDGMPLVWTLRQRGYAGIGRVCGADLVDALCEASQDAGVKHYFYGGKPGVAERMAAALKQRYPRLQVAGTSTPPFRPMTPEEDAAAVAEITASGAKIVWVGISTPKQEFWMRDHLGRIPGATLLGVGAAFDFHAGDVSRSPRWMQASGLEWLHRFLSEPRRLWRRYLVLAPKFAVLQLWSGFRGQQS